MEKEYFSDCCGQPPSGELDNRNLGFCSRCHEGSRFTTDKAKTLGELREEKKEEGKTDLLELIRWMR